MALTWGSTVIGAETTTDLLVHLDASNSSSYAGSGTTWSDISGNGRNFTLVNSPTYTLSGGLGYFTFNGTNQYAVSAAALNLSGYNSITVEVTFDMNSVSQGMVFEHTADWNTNSGGLGLYAHSDGSAGVPNMYHTNHNTGSAKNYFFDSVANWRTHTNVWSRIVDSTGRTVYVNGMELVFDTYKAGYTSDRSTTTGSFANALMYLAARGGSSAFFSGQISTFKVYGRKLTFKENALMFLNKKTRLGL